RSYLAHLRHEDASARDAAQRYWLGRLDALPAAPRLPLAREPEQISPVRFSRRRAVLETDEWRAFQARAGACGVTPT
ncbi:high-molecular-weight protein 2, partial [Escherichia coli]|nr:high-molecular-weight protein 2 [Escherichia coli]